MARFLIYEDKLRRNLQLISEIAERSGAEIIMAFKANALWKSFPIIREYNAAFTASSLNELQLGNEFLGGKAHSYCPVYTRDTIEEFLKGSDHITFNSLSQLAQFGSRARAAGVSPGLRVNPQVSVIETDIYNPCVPGSRFGVTAKEMDNADFTIPDGFHFHCLCESSAEDLVKVLVAFETEFAKWLPHLKWVNMGGGHLMTRKGYNVDLLIKTLRDFRERHPGLKMILEPGSAWTWQTGDLEVEVLDVVENAGIKTAIIDASFACHMPDTLEMPYLPEVAEATDNGKFRYRLGGNSCLSGDFKDGWNFTRPLQPGDKLTLKDMNHYTTVKTTMFNGLQHPDIVLRKADGSEEVLRHFTYQDYKNRMS